ncbi:MAG: DNA-3-methyladenine glycosylase family protein [Ignavibacteria bacterium]
MTARFACSFELPVRYRTAPLFAFHRRDALRTAERVDADTIEKALVWQGAPALLTLRLHSRRADAQLAVDGGAARDSRPRFVAMAKRMLGLDQPVDAFEARHRRHPQVGLLIARQRGLRVPVAATPFEALTWAVTAQQISMGAAVSLRRKLIQITGIRHSGGRLCHPEAEAVSALDEPALRGAGFSTTKARTLLTLAQQVTNGELPLDDWLSTLPVEEIVERLAAIRGIGPWTINYTLLRGFGWVDGSLHGDVAVRRGVQLLTGSEQRLGEEDVRRWLAPFSPWRALVAAHLWAALTQTAG